MFDTAKFFLVGGNLSIDFVNTMIVENGAPKDLLKSLTDVVAWAVATHLLEEANAEPIVVDWNKQPEAGAVLAHIHSFRSMLHTMVACLARGEAASATAVAAINAELQNKRGVVQIRQTESGFDKLFRGDVRESQQLLAPIAESAADLLCYGRMEYLKKCEGAECVLYFYDTTKNHSRRWCSMAGCGNRAKVTAFYKRQRAKAQAGDQQKHT